MSAKNSARNGWSEEYSRLFSWNWCRDYFKEQWLLLEKQNSTEEQNGEPFYKTHYKDVQLLEVSDPRGAYRVALKCYREKRFFRYFMRPSLAAREANGFDVVKAMGIPVVEVLAAGESRVLGHLQNAWFVTRFAENCETLLWFNDHPGEHETLLQLLKETICRLAALHKANFIHGGAHPRNFLWKRSESGELETIWLDLATIRNVKNSRKYWKYILTDLSDLTEYFNLTQEELDSLTAEYRKVNDIPVSYRRLSGHPRKLSEAYKAE